MPSHYRGSESEVRALSAFINLMRASDALAGDSRGRLARRGLTPSQLGALEVLLHLGPQCQGSLAQKLLRCGGSVTALVGGLERRGLVVRERSNDDRRVVEVRLTERGRKLIAPVFREHARVVTRQLAALTAREQDELRRLCRKLGRSVGN